MPSTVAPNANKISEPNQDELDDLFSYDIDKEEVFGSNAQAADNKKRKADETDGLGIDEEIKVVQRRASAVKVDEELICSEKGIPELKRLVKSRLKFKGKGHEFSDVQRLLVLYQLWLDDLYPKATFKDTLSMIEKLGHSRSMQVQRRAWLDEFSSKEKPTAEDNDRASPQQESSSTLPIHPKSPSISRPTPDLYDASPVQRRVSENLFLSDEDEDDIPDEDELDALLGGNITAKAPPIAPESKMDDLDALLEEEAVTQEGVPRQEGGADEEDAAAFMAQVEHGF